MNILIVGILIIGGSGYIGSVLTTDLLQAGHEVTVLNNFMFKQESLAASCIDLHFHLVRGDAR
jgi:nucleoside-diphosphate-sugar epimerase